MSTEFAKLEMDESSTDRFRKLLSFQDQAPRPFNVPKLGYEFDRWSTTSRTNVENMRQRWANNPNLAVVLEDPKLKDQELVILRREVLEKMQKLLLDLQDGRAGVAFDVDLMFKVAAAFESILEEKRKNGEIKCDEPLYALGEAVCSFAGKIRSQFFVMAKQDEQKFSQVLEDLPPLGEGEVDF